MIDFEVPESVKLQTRAILADELSELRAMSRYYDEHEHERPWDRIREAWEASKIQAAEMLERLERDEPGGRGGSRSGGSFVEQMLMSEANALSGDSGMGMSRPGSGLGGAALRAAGTREQAIRFLKRFTEGEPKWAAMAMTEPGAGSDTASIQTTARRDGNEWVLNGEKIFCTNGRLAGQESDGFIVVWATLDKSAGRAGMRAFLVEARTPGMTITKVEKKMGLRASETAAIHFEDCRIPLDHLLGEPIPEEGSAEAQDSTRSKGFQGAMATFDSSRPGVAAGACGTARVAFEFARTELAKEGVTVPYGVAKHKLTAVQRDMIKMEAQIRAAWLLTLRAGWLLDQKSPNNMEASMAKAKAGRTATDVTEKVVELLGPLGYSRQLMAEKWMRDARITNIFEGTEQINTLIVARRILGFSRRELK